MNRCGKIGILAAALCLLIGSQLATADDKSKAARDQRGNPKDQHDEALQAVKRGEIRPLIEAQAVAEKAMPGRVVGVKYERRKERHVYEFKIIVKGGRVREVYVDATTLAVVKVE